MMKKLTLLVASASALLVFIAPAAQAEGPLITNSEGGAAKTVTATSETMLTHIPTIPGNQFTCATTNVHINLTSNASTTANGHGAGTMEGSAAVQPTTHTGSCKYGFASATVTSLTVNDFHLTKHGGETTGIGTFVYTFDVHNASKVTIAECTFTAVASMTPAEGNTIEIHGESVKTGGGVFCPIAGKLEAHLDLFDESGEPVTIH